MDRMAWQKSTLSLQLFSEAAPASTLTCNCLVGCAMSEPIVCMQVCVPDVNRTFAELLFNGVPVEVNTPDSSTVFMHTCNALHHLPSLGLLCPMYKSRRGDVLRFLFLQIKKNLPTG